jgi:hypothetical protein|nr:MAG TPA: hypothetical protein [Caudoviricetes sp.]
MSNDKTEVLPTTTTAAAAATAAAPVRRSILRAASAQPERPAAPFADWRGQAQTEELPAIAARPAVGRPTLSCESRESRSRRSRVSTHRKPTGGREARRTAPVGTKVPLPQSRLSRHLRRHLRAALAGIALAAALLIPMQLFAAQGISSGRQAALAARSGQASPTASPAATLSGQSTHSEQSAPSPMSGQSPSQPDWVTEHTGAAYDRTNPAASPLDLPRCTTSPDTPLPCLATISPSQQRAVVLEEDASLTALVRR